MLKSYLNFVSKTWILWATFISFNLITFGIFKILPNLEGLLIDLQFSYDRAEVLTILGNIGSEGRTTYLWANLIDMIFPFFYGSFFAGFLYRFRTIEHLWSLALVPVLLAFVDIGENMQIRAMLSAYPNISETQAFVASLFTSTKQTLLYVTLTLFVITGGAALMRYFRPTG